VERTSSPAEVIRFGAFEVDTRTGELRKHGLRIRLQEQPFQVLCLLLARPGELVTRDELRSKLWSAGTFVDFEHGLNKAMSKLREALDDDRETPRYIETLPRRGYRFLAPTSSTAGPATLPGDSQAVPGTQPGRVEAGSPRRARWLTPAMILLLAVLTVSASWLLSRLVRRRISPVAATVSAAPIRSLAVLPLENLSGDKNQEYFADGMTDELITDLGQMSALRVISRTSVMHYKGTDKTLPQIGRELGADAIVEGAVSRAGGRVRITAQLIDARTDRHLWAHQYERDLRDVIGMQDEVARDIADEIRIKLTPAERARLAASRPVNPEAHEAYLKGRYYWNRFTEANTEKSLKFFRQAIEKDPNYALGYSGLADFYGVMYVRYEARSHNDACPKAEAAALRAVELDPSLAEARNSLGAIRLFCDWDLQGAESELKRAVELNPNYSEAHRVYALFLLSSGREQEATVEIARAVENDPMSADINLVAGWVYFEARHYDHAIEQYRKAFEMDPKRAGALYGLGSVYAQQGRFDWAIREYRKAVELSGGSPARHLN
jgi:TolB-like protein/DNA-binding winged helix-turn-helix (wHTH) protein/Flp pilus assembly protein TadD